MNRVFLLSSMCLFACSAGQSPGGDDDLPPPPDFPQQCPEVACTAGPAITQASQLSTFVDTAATWDFFGPYTSGCLPASSDVSITGTLTVLGDSVTLPANCANNTDCRHTVKFRVHDPIAGVTCEQPEEFFDFTLCGALTIADTTVRIRGVVEDIHPFPEGNFTPIIDVLPACVSACATNQVTCEAAHTCWTTVRDHCAYCLGGSNEECACWDGTNLSPDGAACQMFISGDLEVSGSCQAGACVAQ